MTEVFLSLGSNINRENNIRAAVTALRRLLSNVRCSSVYESEAVGFKGDNFYNLVVQAQTDLTLPELSAQLKQIEDAQGRERGGPRFSGRTLDIDIILYGDYVGQFAGIELPRPELYANAFVLLPLAELTPKQLDPATGQCFESLWHHAKIQQRLWVVPFAFDGLPANHS